MEKVYLSSKKVFLEKIPVPPCRSDEAEFVLNYSLRQMLKVIRADGSEINLPPTKDVWGSILKASTTRDGRWCFIYSVYRAGLVGLFLYRQNDNFMTEMVGPDLDNERKVEVLEIGI